MAKKYCISTYIRTWVMISQVEITWKMGNDDYVPLNLIHQHHNFLHQVTPQHPTYA